ncbi:MAG: aldehyde dehydrogenase family protein, partial [Mycobacterium sp.]|nr:aldehyde dehydrogenase family protein [Mycobacterium sp.]
MQDTAAISNDRHKANGDRREVARRLLIGGQLLEAEHTFASLNPATGDVLGYAPDASVADAEAAITAARHAFDEGTWATDTALRIRCLEQLH